MNPLLNPNTLIRFLRNSLNCSPLWRAFLLASLVLVCFALSPTAQAVSPTPDGEYEPGFNCAEGGLSALQHLTTGTLDVALGVQALQFNTTGSMNTAAGYAALFSNTTGLSNTATGMEALLHNTLANNNAAHGAFALRSNTTGTNNTAGGEGALFSNTTGNNNTANGTEALISNTTGLSNTAVGFQALLNNTLANNNVAVGAFALSSNTTGGGSHNSGLNETGPNVAVGTGALFSNTTHGANTAVGFAALSSVDDFQSTAVGFKALTNAGFGPNTAFGFQALGTTTTGDSNTGVGFGALFSQDGAFNNTALGANAGNAQTTGSDNIYIGNGMSGVAGENGHCYIGSIHGVVVGTASSLVRINTDNLLGTSTSSKRFKEDIKPMGKTSEALFGLNPVTFRYKKELDPNGGNYWGLVAEEVQKVNPELVVLDKQGLPMTVRYDVVDAMLLNEFLKEHRVVLEQQKEIDALKAQLKEQKTLIQKVSDKVELIKPAPQMVRNQ